MLFRSKKIKLVFSLSSNAKLKRSRAAIIAGEHAPR